MIASSTIMNCRATNRVAATSEVDLHRHTESDAAVATERGAGCGVFMFIARVTVSLISVGCPALNTFAASDYCDFAKLINTTQSESGVFGSPRDGFDESMDRVTLETARLRVVAGANGAIYGEASIVKKTPLCMQGCNHSDEATKVQEIKF